MLSPLHGNYVYLKIYYGKLALIVKLFYTLESVRRECYSMNRKHARILRQHQQWCGEMTGFSTEADEQIDREPHQQPRRYYDLTLSHSVWKIGVFQ